MKREDVEALPREIVETLALMASEGRPTPVPAPMLAELCRTWRAVNDAPVVPVELGIDVDGETYFYAEAAPEFDGQQVRLVRVGGG